jgi:nucleotide-binding universal stress UspA family protein
MKTMNILVPTDFSDNSFRALGYVYRHFSIDKINVTVMHTIEEPHSTAFVMKNMDRLMQKDADSGMKGFLKTFEKYFPDLQKPKSVIVRGYFNDWVNEYADSQDIDLVVMGSKGVSNDGGLFFGSVTQSVIRLAKIPVLAIPNKDIEKPISLISIATPLTTLPHEDFLNSFSNIITPNQPELEIIRVVNEDSNDKFSDNEISLNGKPIPEKYIENDFIVLGLKEYLENSDTDIVGIFNKSTSGMEYLFGISSTRNLMSVTTLPLLAMPLRK